MPRRRCCYPAVTMARPTPSGTPRLPAAERRQQLLEVALAVFGRHGFHHTSMNDLAEAAGVTKPVLYQHFGSKRELYLEVLREVGGRLMDAVGKAIAAAPGPRQQVEGGFRAYFQWVDRERSGFEVLFAGDTRRDPEFLAELGKVETEFAQAIAELIAVDGMTARTTPAAGLRHRRHRRDDLPPLDRRRPGAAVRRPGPGGAPTWPGPACAASAPTDPAHPPTSRPTDPGERPASRTRSQGRGAGASGRRSGRSDGGCAESSACSSTWAPQPTMRLVAKAEVNRLDGNPQDSMTTPA